MKRVFAAFFIISVATLACHAARDISWIGVGATGAKPLGVTVKHWFNDKEGGIRFANFSFGRYGDENQVFLDYAWEDGMNFTGIYRGISILIENGGFGVGPSAGIETFRLLDIGHMNLSLDAGPFLRYSGNKFDVVFYARLALRYRTSAG